MKYLLFIYTIFFSFIQTHQTTSSKSDHVDYDQKIAEKILKNYHRRSKPPGTIEVKFAMHLNQIVNLIEKEQNIVLNVFIDHEWVDSRLAWDPKVFCNYNYYFRNFFLNKIVLSFKGFWQC